MNDRFTDNGRILEDFYAEFLVVCPRCAKMARVLPDESIALSNKKIDQLRNKVFGPRRLVCVHCAHIDSWSGSQIIVGANCDWFFRLPLWLEISCCGDKLWAYNLEHLETIEKYVSAKLRERTTKGRNSFLSKLPTWIKSAKNRDEILKAIGRLKEKI